MADMKQIKNTAVIVLGCLEKVSSFASSFNPLFGIVTKLIGAVKKGLMEDDTHKLDKDFQQIHDKLQSISEQNKQILEQIQIAEIEQNYGDLVKKIEHQYRAFKEMVDNIRKRPEKDQEYRARFKHIYLKQKSRLNLNSLYASIVEEHGPFGRPLLKIFLEHSEKSRKIMEDRCTGLIYVFHTGLIALMAYYVVAVDDKDEFLDEWGPRVLIIQTKMQEILDECSEK